MTEVEQLQKQIEELKKTVDDLKSGCVKVVSMKDILSEKECEIFWQYFQKQDYSDHCFSKNLGNGIVTHYGGKVSANFDQLRKSIRDAARSIYFFNTLFEEVIKSDNVYQQLFYKRIKTDEQLNEYLKIFKSICEAAHSNLQDNKFRKSEE